MQAVALWQLVRKADPSDAEAQHKINDLAATQTIHRTLAKESGGKTPARPAKQATDTTPRKTSEVSETSEVTDTKQPPKPAPAPADRLSQEMAAIRARIEADPTNPSLYLQLAGLHRRNGQLEQAREVLQGGLGPTGNHFDLATELADIDIEPFRQDLAITEQKLHGQPHDEELRKVRSRLLKEINARELELLRHKSERNPTEHGQPL